MVPSRGHEIPILAPQPLPVTASPARKAIAENPSMAHLPLSQSEASLPYRRPSPSAASLFASTLTPPGSRPLSPVGHSSPSRLLAGSVFGGGTRSSFDSHVQTGHGSPPHIVSTAFVPHIAILASEDTDQIAAKKGFQYGLWELLRPFGEQVTGKVTIRDSNGASRSWEDYSVRFTKFGENIEQPEPATGSLKPSTIAAVNGAPLSTSPSRANAFTRNILHDSEAVVEHHLKFAEESISSLGHILNPIVAEVDSTSPYYSLYLRRLLSGLPVAPHESFAHPVACVIAISSRNPDPIATLRDLYSESSKGNGKFPEWVDSEYLRYYVLVHDEENDDIARSMSLYEQMKRHFGLHCHLLRLRSSRGAETDDDSIPLPRNDWMTASDELAILRRGEDEDFQDPTLHIFESDATAIRTFTREMVTQSIIPTMERHVSVWNDQVASRRRGLSGRLMNLSRRWGGFGSSSRSSVVGSSSSSNYDSMGFYRPESSEATMRRLADFAFMLRDWKLAYSTYDLLRSDYSNDKAWKFHAAANEMAAISLLMSSQAITSKTRLETIDQMLEAAFYSYHTRCSASYGAVRSLLLGMELLRLRGGSSIDDAVRWGVRLLEARLIGRVGEALLKERLAACYGSKQGVSAQILGGRGRKSALWSILSAEMWLQQSKFVQAQRCLNDARKKYMALPSRNGIDGFALANQHLALLEQQTADGLAIPGDSDRDSVESEEEVEVIEDNASELMSRPRSKSILGAQGKSLETAPLRGQPFPEVYPNVTKGAFE